jgi:hypothetical protein
MPFHPDISFLIMANRGSSRNKAEGIPNALALDMKSAIAKFGHPE